MATDLAVRGEDIPLDKLVPLHERKINFKTNRGFRKIVASIEAIGLIEPLCVYREGEKHIILDGYLRFRACQQLGIARVPCLLYESKEAYTFNRMVNRLSPVQEIRMLRKSLETVDESTIAQVFGQKSMRYRLGTALLKQLHPSVVRALDKGLLTRRCASELTYIAKDRQAEILRDMERSGDYGVSFARAMVTKTPQHQRSKERKPGKRWAGDPAKKRELVGKLEAIEKRHGFYVKLYRQYCNDLLKLCFYVRKLVTNEEVRTLLEGRFRQVLERFEQILVETEGRPGDQQPEAEGS